jgi:hypothetical protein
MVCLRRDPARALRHARACADPPTGAVEAFEHGQADRTRQVIFGIFRRRAGIDDSIEA